MLGKGLESLIPKKTSNDDSSGQISKKQNNSDNSDDAKGSELINPIRPIEPIGPMNPISPIDPIRPINQIGPISNRRGSYTDAIFHIEVEKIKPNPFQPRKNFDEGALKDLADSIREFGIIQPLVVSKIEKDTETGTDVEYQLIAGERRLMAAKILGLERVPVIIRQTSQKEEQLELAIIENIQRENLDVIETARAYARLQEEFGLTQKEISVRVGKSREAVANTLRLLDLPVAIQDAISKGKITESHARLLLSIMNPERQKQLFEDLLKTNMTVRQLKHHAHKIEAGENLQIPSDDDFAIKELEEKLKEILGTDVKIDKKSGKIVISFYSDEEIYGIIDKIKSPENKF